MSIRKAGSHEVKKDSDEAKAIEKTHGFQAAATAKAKRDEDAKKKAAKSQKEG